VAAGVDALRAPLDPYDETVGELAGEAVLAAVLARLRRALEGSAPAGVAPAEGRASQAPVSFRVTPQVHAHLARTLGRLDEDVRRSLAAVTDSPAVVGGRVVAGGGFRDLGLAAGMDALAVALVQAAELAGQRLHRLLDGRFSGLPGQLTPAPGWRWSTSGPWAPSTRPAGLRDAGARLAELVAPVDQDRPLGQDLAALVAALERDELRLP
jgi:histidine ammonia-lyase